MGVLLKLATLIDRIVAFIGSITPWIVLVMIAMGFLNVVARYAGRFLGVSLTSNGIIEAQWYLFSMMFFLGFAHNLQLNLNVRVDFLSSKWSVRRRAFIEMMGHLLFLIPFCILGIYVTFTPVLFSWGYLPNGTFGTWEISPDPGGLPRAPIKSMIIVAFVLLMIQAIAQVIKYAAVLLHKADDTLLQQLQMYEQTAVE